MTAQNTETPAIPTEPGRMWTHIDGLEFVAIRVFEAPSELVFRAWSSCEHLSQWWGPDGWTLPVCEMDFRPGGRWFYGMRGPHGEDAFGLATYEQIVQPSLITFSDAFADKDGNVDTSSSGHAGHRPVHRGERADDAHQPQPVRLRRRPRAGRRDGHGRRADRDLGSPGGASRGRLTGQTISGAPSGSLDGAPPTPPTLGRTR